VSDDYSCGTYLLNVASRVYYYQSSRGLHCAIRSHKGHFHYTRPQETYCILQTGHLTIIDGPPAKRLILTANCDYTPDVPGPSVFTFLIDVILVPRFINVKWEMPCFYLYKTPFDMRQPPEGYMGLRSLQDNIILVRRIAFQGAFTACTVEHCDFPQDVSNLSDYRLVVTCPLLHTWPLGTLRGLSVILHLEVEYEKET
jgi:hypothetical protein